MIDFILKKCWFIIYLFACLCSVCYSLKKKRNHATMYNSQALFCFRVFCRYMHTLTLLFSLFRLSFLRHFCSFSRTLSRQTTLLHAQLIHLHPPTHTQPNIHQTTFLLDTFPHSAWLVLRVRYSTCD